MSEPTREQIKEAFQGTIARWERIVEDPSYYHKSDCWLCQVYGEFEGDKCCHKYCPIRLYGDYPVCKNTPHDDFCAHISSERLKLKETLVLDAIAELNFLRKVYIWWMEQGKIGIKGKPEEKKEEWEDITDRVFCFFHHHEPYYDIHFSEVDNKRIADCFGWIFADGDTGISDRYKDQYRIEQNLVGNLLKILKKI